MASLPHPVRVAAAALLALSACGDDGGASSDGDVVPTVVVTTSILGDVVESMLAGSAEVVTIIPAGAGGHDFAPSARDLQALRTADAVVANGAGFEEGLTDALEAAVSDGATVFEATSAVEVLAAADGATDPHFFTDPASMVDAAQAIADFLLAEIPVLDSEATRARIADQVAGLRALDAELEAELSVVADERRVLVTNHDVFAYFAQRYDFELAGSVLSGSSTAGAASAADLAALAGEVRERRLPAVFADASEPDDVMQALAAEAGPGVEVVPLFTEALGPPGSGAATYEEMMRTNVARIVGALS